MARAGYPKEARLRLRRDFHRLVGNARIYPGRECLVRVMDNDCGQARVGMAAPRRYGNAVRRNRFRRLVREAFRDLRGELGAVDLLVSPRKQLEEPTLAGIRADLAAAPQRARTQRPRRSR
jgi:ribonuclease P protein component